MDTNLPIEAPSLSRRQLLNFLTGATVAATTGSALYVADKFLVPPAEITSAGGAILAKDVLGNPIPASQILAEPAGSCALVAGLRGNPLISSSKPMPPSTGWGLWITAPTWAAPFPGIR